MNILDRSVEELFKSINLEEDDEEEESDNESNYNESNDNDSNDNESIDNDSSQMMSITFNKECSSKTNNEQDGNE